MNLSKNWFLKKLIIQSTSYENTNTIIDTICTYILLYKLLYDQM